MSSSLPTGDLKEILASAQLPALPQSAIRLIELSQDASNGPNEFSKPIEADAGLMGQVLRFVNSSYFGFSREIASVQTSYRSSWRTHDQELRAVERGLQLDSKPEVWSFRFEELVARLAASRDFRSIGSRHLKLPNAEDLFAAALLQDMAIPLLLKELPEQYQGLIERCSQERMRLSQLERQVFGGTMRKLPLAWFATGDCPKSSPC